MGWNSSTKKMTSPVSMQDIKDAVEYNSLDLATLIKEGDINVWARYKPYRSALTETLPDSDRGNSTYKWGMDYPVFNSPIMSSGGNKLYQVYDSDTATNIEDRMNGWQYLRPRRYFIDNEWFRMLDFVGEYGGYYSGADVPLRFAGGTYNASTSLGDSTAFTAIRKQSYDAAELDFSDFGAIDGYYFAMVGYKTNGTSIPSSISSYFVVSASTPISTGNFSVTVSFTQGNFHVTQGNTEVWFGYPCLCSSGGVNFYGASGQSIPSDAIYIPIPCAKKWTINISTSGTRWATLEAFKYNNNHSYIRYRFTIHNDSSAYTFTNVVVWMLHSGHTPDRALDSDEKQIYQGSSQGSITVPAMDSWTTGLVDQGNVAETLWQDVVLFATTDTQAFSRVGGDYGISPMMLDVSNGSIHDDDIPIPGPIRENF